MHQEEMFWVISGESSLGNYCLLSFISFLIGESRDLAGVSKAVLLKETTLAAAWVLMGHP